MMPPNKPVRTSLFGVGLTKRELFAAMAMQGLLAEPKKIRDGQKFLDELTAASVVVADALIAALSAPAS